MEHPGDVIVGAASWPITNIADALDGAGAWSWGWAVVVVAAGWRLLALPLVVRQGSRRIMAVRLHAEHSQGRDMRHRDQRAVVGARVRQDLSALTGRRRLPRVVMGALQVVAVLAVAVWSRGAPAAGEHGFAGLSRLDALAVTLGPAGFAWAAALGACFLVTAVVSHRGAGEVAGHQAVIDRVVTPTFFGGLGLVLPAAVLVAFVAGMLVTIVGLLIAAVSRSAPRPVVADDARGAAWAPGTGRAA